MKNKKRKGYTLVEILVVVMILGILAASSVPLYNRLIQRSDVSDALHNIDMFSGAQGKYFIENNSYTDDLSELETPLKGDNASISTTNFTYSAGDVSEGNYCIYAQSNSRDYTLAKNYRSHSEILCSGNDCGDISGFVKEGSISDLCNGTFNDGSCDLVCNAPKILHDNICKCVCPNKSCSGNKIIDPDTCACKCPREKEEACGANLNLETCTCEDEPTPCSDTFCNEGYFPDPDDNCNCKCKLTAENCSAVEELINCSCQCKQSIIDSCDTTTHNIDGNCNCKCKTKIDCQNGQNFNEDTCTCNSNCERTEEFCKQNYSDDYTLDNNCECVCGISAQDCEANGENWTLFDGCKCGCKKKLACGSGETFNSTTCACEPLEGCEPGTIEETAYGASSRCSNPHNYPINMLDGNWGNDTRHKCARIVQKTQICNQEREWEIELTCGPMYEYCSSVGMQLNLNDCECTTDYRGL